MALLRDPLMRPLTLQEAEELRDSARIALDCYSTALADPKVVIPTPLHAAMHKLKIVMDPLK